MCIAVYKPAGVTIPDDTLQRCWDNNPHGAGIAYPTGNGRVKVHKTLDRDEFTKLWKLVPQDRSVVVHFRYATHGRIGRRNTHPFTVAPGLVVAHNGVIHETASEANDFRSDTRVFVDRVLTPAWRKWGTEGFEDRLFDSEEFRDWLDSRIGASKLVFLNRDGQVAIVGEHRGEWADGVWYSNSGWRRAPVRRRKRRPAKRRPVRYRTVRPVRPALFDADPDPYQDVWDDPYQDVWDDPYHDDAWDDYTPTTLEILRAEAHRILKARPEPEQWTSTDCYVIGEAYADRG